MNVDDGVIFVVMKHFTSHLHPRLVAIEKALDAGGRLDEE